MLIMFQSSLAEPPLPGQDLKHGIRTELDQRTLAITTGITTGFSGTDTPTHPSAVHLPVPQNMVSENNVVGIPSVPGPANIYRESIPMQESMVDVAQEHRLSLTDLGFEHVPKTDTRQQSATGHRQQDDLMVFSSMVSDKQNKEVGTR